MRVVKKWQLDIKSFFLAPAYAQLSAEKQSKAFYERDVSEYKFLTVRVSPAFLFGSGLKPTKLLNFIKIRKMVIRVKKAVHKIRYYNITISKSQFCYFLFKLFSFQILQTQLVILSYSLSNYVIRFGKMYVIKW